MLVHLAVLSCVAAATVAVASSPKTIEIAPGVNMPFANLGGVDSEPSNYSAWLELGGRGLDTGRAGLTHTTTRNCLTCVPSS